MIIDCCDFNESVIFNNYLMELPFEASLKKSPIFSITKNQYLKLKALKVTLILNQNQLNKIFKVN